MFTTKAKGQGFGLAVIKRMISSHGMVQLIAASNNDEVADESLGGTVTFKSEEGKGAKLV